MPIQSRTVAHGTGKRLRGVIHRIAQIEISVVEQTVFWVWVGLLSFGVLSFGAVEPWSQACLEIGSAALMVWWLLAGMHRQRLRVSLPPILLPGIAFVGLILLQLIGRFSVYRFASQNALFVFLSSAICVFIGAQVLDSENSFRNFGLAACAFGFLMSLLAIAQSLTSRGEIYWMIYPKLGDGVFGTYVNHSHYAGLMEMLIPFPFVLGFGRTLRRRFRGLAFVVATVMVGSVFMSASRGGIVAVAVQLCLVYFLLYREGDEAGRNPSQPNKRLVNIVALAAAFLVVLLLGGQEMISRISTLKDPYGSSVGATRLLIAKDCLKMFAQHPFVGWGAGVFQEVYPSFRTFSTNLVVNAAHNDYLQLLVEYGLTGVALSLWFLWFAYRRFSLLRLNWKDSWPHAVSFAALLGTLGILVHSLTDFNLQVPANATLFYVMCLVSSLPAPQSIVSNHDPQETS